MTVERDIWVSKHIIDELVHIIFLKFAPFARLAAKLGWTSDLFLEKVADINTTVFATDESARDTAAFESLAAVGGSVEVISGRVLGRTASESAVE